MKWYIKGFQNAFNTHGRASMEEYWMFVLFNMIFSFVALGIDTAIGLEVPVVTLLYSIVVVFPSISLGVRRLHDSNTSGKLFFIALVPLIGSIVLLIYFLKKGDAEENRYGAPPSANSSRNALSNDELDDILDMPLEEDMDKRMGLLSMNVVQQIIIGIIVLYLLVDFLQAINSRYFSYESDLQKFLYLLYLPFNFIPLILSLMINNDKIRLPFIIVTAIFGFYQFIQRLFTYADIFEYF